MKKSIILFIISALFLVMTTAQFNDDINTNSISFVTPTTAIATTTAVEMDPNNLPAVTMTMTEISTTTIFPKQTVATPSTTTTTSSNDASR